MKDIVLGIAILLAAVTAIAFVICLYNDYLRRMYLLPDTEEQEVDFELARFFKGFIFDQTPTGFILRFATRSQERFLLVPFAFLWTGGWLALFYGTQVMAIQFNLIASFLGLPFIIAGAFYCFHTLRMVIGHVTIIVEGEKGLILEGIGGLCWRTTFHWPSISQIYKSRTWRDRNNITHSLVVLVEGSKHIAFGGHPVSEPTRQFIVAILRMMRANRRNITSTCICG